jgi:hypothetical protein
VLGVVVAATLVGASPVRAQTDEAEGGPVAPLGGFEGSAAASGVHAYYNAGDILPIPPPIDIGAPDALATIASGPSTFARASVLDPGDLLANPDAVLALASADYPAGTVPAYPFRVSASSGIGAPVAESNPAPGLNARVAADTSSSSAQASMPALGAPAVLNVGSLSSRATTTTDGSTVTVRSFTQLTGINILGIITIDSVTTDLTASSDGQDTKLSGGTTVVGASAVGQPITIDVDGIHQAPGAPSILGGLLGPIAGSLNDILRAVGVHITLAGPVELDGRAAGQLASAGLRVDLELSPTTFPQLAALLNALPPIENPVPGVPSIEDVLFLAQARHLVAVELGRGVVSLQARPAGDAFTPSEPPVDTGDAGFVPSTSPTFASPDLPVSSGGAPVARTDGLPKLPISEGVGALVLLALLAQPFLGERIAWIANAVLAANRPDSCSWEET